MGNDSALFGGDNQVDLFYGLLSDLPEDLFNVHAKYRTVFNKLYNISHEEMKYQLIEYAKCAGRKWNDVAFSETLRQFRYQQSEFCHLQIFEPSKFFEVKSNLLDGMVSKFSLPLLFSWMMAWYASTFHLRIATIPPASKFAGVDRESYFSASNFEHVFNAFQHIPFTLEDLRSTFQQHCMDLNYFKDILVGQSINHGSFRCCVWEPRFLLLFFRDVNPVLEKLVALHDVFQKSVVA